MKIETYAVLTNYFFHVFCFESILNTFEHIDIHVIAVDFGVIQCGSHTLLFDIQILGSRIGSSCLITFHSILQEGAQDGPDQEMEEVKEEEPQGW